MDHGAPKKQCPHGRCLRHSPEWVIATPMVSEDTSRILKIFSFFFDRCCKKPLIRMIKVTHQHCGKCGRVGPNPRKERFLAPCFCCGYKKPKQFGCDIIFGICCVSALLGTALFFYGFQYESIISLIFGASLVYIPAMMVIKSNIISIK